MDNNNKVLCPDCQSEIVIDETKMVGDILECEECGTEVEIVSMEPVSIKELIEEK